LNIPAGFGETGLPMGLQIMGPRHSDAKLLRIAQRWHEATAFSKVAPDLARLSS
jgi:amidase